MATNLAVLMLDIEATDDQSHDYALLRLGSLCGRNLGSSLQCLAAAHCKISREHVVEKTQATCGSP